MTEEEKNKPENKEEKKEVSAAENPKGNDPKTDPAENSSQAPDKKNSNPDDPEDTAGKKEEKFSEFKNRIKKERASLLRFFPKIISLMSKNIKLIIRSKASSLIFFFGPLLIILSISLTFNTSSLYDLDVAVYSDTYSTLTNDIISSLGDSTYKVTKTESEEACINALKFHNAHACLVFPANMLLDNSGNNVVQIYVDSSRMNIAYILSQEISSKVAVKASKLSEDMVTKILVALDNVNKDLAKKKPTLDKVISDLTTSKEKTASATSKLSEIDLDYVAASTETVYDEIKKIEDNNNATYSSLRNAFKTVADSYSALTSKVSAAAESLNEIENYVSNADSLASTSKERLNTVKTGFDNAIAEVGKIKITNVDNIVNPLRTSIEPISTQRSFLTYAISTLLVLMFMFVSLLLSSTMVLNDRRSKAYFRNFITPTSDGVFLTAEFITAITVLIIQIVLSLGVIAFFIEGLSLSHFAMMGTILLLVSSVFVAMGMALGYFFKSTESVTIASMSVGIILLFFSNAILPLESIVRSVRELLYFNPFVIGESIIRQIILFNGTFSQFSIMIYALLGWMVACMIGAYVFRKLSKRFKI